MGVVITMMRVTAFLEVDTTCSEVEVLAVEEVLVAAGAASVAVAHREAGDDIID